MGDRSRARTYLTQRYKGESKSGKRDEVEDTGDIEGNADTDATAMATATITSTVHSEVRVVFISALDLLLKGKPWSWTLVPI